MPGLLQRSRLTLRQWSTDLLDEVAPTQQQIAEQQGDQANPNAAADSNAWRPDQPSQYCHRCGASTGPGAATNHGCAHCVKIKRLAWQGIVRLTAFKSPVDHWIHALKYHGQWTWADWFGRHLAEAIRHEEWTQQVVFCPVPMHWSRRWHRGYNQAALLAESLSLEVGCPHAHLLKRIRRTPPQTFVDIAHRNTNLRDAIGPTPIDLTGWHVVLVDDVKTTGATLTACAKALRSMNPARISAACIAVRDPSQQDFSAI